MISPAGSLNNKNPDFKFQISAGLILYFTIIRNIYFLYPVSLWSITINLHNILIPFKGLSLNQF